ncbi:Serine/threonine-protein kinase [Nymphaea thermarum]|nr:Serine/threonine-protein kinase [Nymphaea thermarum]
MERKVEGTKNRPSSFLRPGCEAMDRRSEEAAPIRVVNSNPRPPELPLPAAGRPVNFSIQTGEEFALQFIQDRGAFRKPFAPSDSSRHAETHVASSSNPPPAYEDHKTVIGMPRVGSEGGSEASVIAGERASHGKGLGNKVLTGGDNRGVVESAENAPYNSLMEGSSRGRSRRSIRRDTSYGAGDHGYGSSGTSDSSLSGRMKLFCSFGGRILPRPSDGKLRYVGGDTRIVKIRRDISFDDFMQRMLSVHEQVSVVKYQLPGEDLDALVSVTCDEDLQNMMDEWLGTEGLEGSHKLRIFLLSQSDLEDANNDVVSSEIGSDYQYVIAVNGLAETEARKSSIGHGLTSASGTHLDQLISLNAGGEEEGVRVEGQSVAASASSLTDILLPASTELLHTMPSAGVLPAATATVSSHYSHYGAPSRHDATTFYHGNAAHYGVSVLQPVIGAHPFESSYHAESGTAVPSAPLHEYSQSYYGHFEGVPPVKPSQSWLPPRTPAPNFHAAASDAGLKLQELQAKTKEMRTQGGSFVAHHDYASIARDPKNDAGHLTRQFDIATLPSCTAEHVESHTSNNLGGFPVSVFPPAPVASVHEGVTKSVSPLTKTGSDPWLSDSLHAGQFHETNKAGIGEDQSTPSEGVLTSHAENNTDYGYVQQPVLSQRAFQSERIPREQIDSQNRLTKSDDSINSHFLMLGLQQAGSITESDDGAVPGELSGSQAKASPSCATPSLEDGILQFQEHKDFPSTIAQKTNSPNKQERLEAPNVPENFEGLDGKEPALGLRPHDHEESGTKPVIRTPPNQVKEKAEASSLKVIVGVGSEKDLVGRGQVQQDIVKSGPLEVMLSDDSKISKEGKAGQPKIKDQPLEMKEKKGVSSPSYNLQASESLQPKEKSLVKEVVHGSHVIDIEVGTPNMVQANSTSILPEARHGLRSENQEKVAGFSPAFPWDASPGGVNSQMQNLDSVSKDVKGDLKNVDRTSPELLSDLFLKASDVEPSGINPLHTDEAGLSFNMPNHEPQSWSFFRQLAQNEFVRNDMSLLDQNILSYPPVPVSVGEGNSGYYYPPFKGDVLPLGQNIQDHSGITQKDSPVVLRNDANLLDKGGESAKVEDTISYSNMPDGEILPIPESEYEVGKSEMKNVGGPIFDPSLDDFDMPDLQIINNSDLEELRELGSGTFGTVYHGKWRGTDVAIKRIKKSCFTGRSSEQERLTHDFWREAAILSKLHHPNVVAFYGVVKDGPGGTLATVTEFMVNGSLRHVLQRKDRLLDRRKKLMIAMEAAFGMEYLHSKSIVHFDLKCDNLLVNMRDPQHPVCKVGDFGLSKIKRNTLVSGGVRGTLPWMAPELLNGSSSKVSEKVDVFSFGIVMWEILTGDEPYANMHYGAIIGGIVNNTLRPHVPSWCDPEWRKLMEQCWAPDPSARPSFTDIVRRLRMMTEKPGVSGR